MGRVGYLFLPNGKYAPIIPEPLPGTADARTPQQINFTSPHQMGNHRNNRVPQNGQAGAATARAQQLYTEGISFHRAGRLGEAAAAYEQVLRLVPKHFGALHHIGILAFEGGNYELAAGFIRSALAVNPNVAAAYSDLGNALKEQAQFDQALENYDKAIALNPGDANAHYNRP